MKLISLLSGGIDSPVASYLMMKKDADVVFVHMDNRPFIDDRPLEKVKKLVAILNKKTKKNAKLYLIPHGKSQSVIVKKAKRKLTCVMCRKIMLEVAIIIAKKEKANGIITGESLGQVASQTLDNIYVENKGISVPVFRPLIGFDKEETIKIAKEIGTYEISILPGQCCNLTPPYPETHSKIDEIKEAEELVDIDYLVEDAVKNAKFIEIK
ncbi:hypothetical protein GQ473_06825 [archaeon]|nr:hypothetical protein [archaeon]